MLAPHCEEESAEAADRELGRRGIALWRETYPGTVANGTLVVALNRDRVELDRFARMTEGHRRLSPAELAAVEPALVDRFAGALFTDEEHISRRNAALHFLLDAVMAEGAALRLGDGEMPQGADLVIDCRGLAAKDDLPTLRGVRGERIVVKSREVDLARPVRLLHPRFPLYVVPWGDGALYARRHGDRERGDRGRSRFARRSICCPRPMRSTRPSPRPRSCMQGAGARPAFPDNRPRIIPRNGYIYVNGLYRHGFLLAPVLAELVAEFIETGATRPGGVRCRSCSTVRRSPPTRGPSTSFARDSALPRRRSPPP